MNATFAFTVTLKQAGTFLLTCLRTAIPYLKPEQWQALLLEEQHAKEIRGSIKVDGIIVHHDVVLSAGQIVSYTINDYQEAEVDCAWSLIWSNADIAAIHKPANLPVNRTTRNVYNTLIQLLRRESPWADAHLLHRLDLETSGIMLIAQNKAIARQYQSRLSDLIERKLYRAVVIGEPGWVVNDVTCDLATLEESEGGTAIRSQMHVVPEGKGKKSRTLFKLLSTIQQEGVSYSLIECELFTGRKHQIRAQLAHLGHPIVGDKIYSNGGEFYLKRIAKTASVDDYAALLAPHHLLHAYEIHLNNSCSLERAQAKDKTTQQQGIILRDDNFPAAWQSFAF